MDDRAELIERLEKLTAPDREIDLLLGELWPEPRPFTLSLKQQRGRKPPVLAFTDSTDAMLALIGVYFPLRPFAWNYTMAALYGSFSIIPNDPSSYGVNDPRCGHAHGAPSIPIAMAIAFVSALLRSDKEAG